MVTDVDGDETRGDLVRNLEHARTLRFHPVGKHFGLTGIVNARSPKRLFVDRSGADRGDLAGERVFDRVFEIGVARGTSGGADVAGLEAGGADRVQIPDGFGINVRESGGFRDSVEHR